MLVGKGRHMPARVIAPVALSPGTDDAFSAPQTCVVESCAEAGGLHYDLRREAEGERRFVLTLIEAGMSEGVNTKSDINGVITQLGFNNRHVALMLDKGTGSSLAGYRWQRGKEGIYALLT